jgi:hypothetical protein
MKRLPLVPSTTRQLFGAFAFAILMRKLHLHPKNRLTNRKFKKGATTFFFSFLEAKDEKRYYNHQLKTVISTLLELIGVCCLSHIFFLWKSRTFDCGK